jgi:hypothetical protein
VRNAVALTDIMTDNSYWRELVLHTSLWNQHNACTAVSAGALTPQRLSYRTPALYTASFPNPYIHH